MANELEAAQDAADVVPGHIRQSWRRCRDFALDGTAAPPLRKGQLDARRGRAARLLACALPELDALTEHATGNGCVVVLSDASGLILEEIGSPEFLPRAERVALTPGVDWSERLRGTNAIGTALADGAPVLVLGAEHYLPQNAALGCAAAPIFTGTGGVAGVLDISGDVQRVNLHALGMVRMAAQQIEHRLLLADARGHLLRFHAREELIGSPREALLVVDDGRIAAANRSALALLGRQWSDLLGRPVESLFGAGWAASDNSDNWSLRPVGPPLALRVERLAPMVAAVRPGVGRLPAAWAAAANGPAAGTAPKAAPAPATANAAATAPAADVLRPILDEAVKVLNHGVPVLVSGETGCGKEVFARRLHRASRRAGGPFVAVNCAALPDTLIEAELFGYDEGAFTGARRRGSPGRVREADGGILFLDEIADMPLALQTRLLRVLEDRKVTPLGGGQALAVDFDLVCATHGDLRALAATGAFRPDLLYRVAGYTVALPALRHRADKAVLIAGLFADAGGAAKGLRLEAGAADRLAAHGWPGNVRELCSVLRSIVALAPMGESIGVAQVEVRLGDARPETEAAGHAADAGPRRVCSPPPNGEDAPAVAPTQSRPLATSRLLDIEHEAIEAALDACGRRVADAARQLGVHRSTVYRHLARSLR